MSIAEDAYRTEDPTAVEDPWANLPADPGPQKVSDFFEEAGRLVSFVVQAARDVPVAVRLYPSEVFRHAGDVVRSNALVVVFMLFMLGALLGITGKFLFEPVGLESFVAAINAVPLLRGVIEIVFGWVLAAKMGCGIVAELGAMRISEEIDAMEVMGIRSMPYLVATRVIGAVLTLPFLFLLALGVHFIAARLFFVDLLGVVSAGGFSSVLFLLQSPRDLIIATAWGTIIGVLVTVVACYYGYNAKGGPVGVGRATAQAMLVNLVMISLVSMIVAQFFYAGSFGEAFGT
jgi:phospholipid/cholesterol/gamma-HCH transport system permease protein